MEPRDDEGRLDLSPLDPTRDTLRFEQLVRSVTARVVAQRPPDAGALMIRWWRPALAFAVSMVLAAWVPSLLTANPRSTEAGAGDPAETLLKWARSSGQPSAAEVLDSLWRTP